MRDIYRASCLRRAIVRDTREPAPKAPWEVRVVRPSNHSTYGIHVEGFNHFTGESFRWGLDHYSDLENPERYDWSRAAFMDGARDRFLKSIEIRRREHA